MFDNGYSFNEDYTSKYKLSDDQYNADKHWYMQGRTGFPNAPSESLSERQRAMFMMGWQSTREFGEY